MAAEESERRTVLVNIAPERELDLACVRMEIKRPRDPLYGSRVRVAALDQAYAA